MEATPPELDDNPLAAMSAAWSLVTETDALLSFLHENIPNSNNKAIDSLKVFIFLMGVYVCNAYVTCG